MNPLARRIEVEPPRLAARRHGERDVDAAGAAGGDGVAHEAAAVKFQPAPGRAMPEAQPGSAAAVLTANVGPATEVVVAAAAQQRQREAGAFDRFAPATGVAATGAPATGVAATGAAGGAQRAQVLPVQVRVFSA